MTWRRFSALLRGLGPESAVVSRAVGRRAAERSGAKIETITDREQAEAKFKTLFAPPG